MYILMVAFQNVSDYLFLFLITLVSNLQLAAICDAISVTPLRSQTPARNSRKSTQFSRERRRCRLALFSSLPRRGKIETMAAREDELLDFSCFANERELEEFVCVLGGSDSENCSYSQVSPVRVPEGSFCSFVRPFYKLKDDRLLNYKPQQLCSDVCPVCTCFGHADVGRALWGGRVVFPPLFPKFFTWR